MIFATADHIATLLSISPRIRIIRMLVIVGDVSPETREVLKAWGASVDIDVRTFAEGKESSNLALLC